MKLQLEDRFLNNHKFHKQMMEKSIFVQIVVIELQRLLIHLSKIRKVVDPTWNYYL